MSTLKSINYILVADKKTITTFQLEKKCLIWSLYGVDPGHTAASGAV